MKTKKLKSTPDLEKVFNTKEKHINYAYIGRLTEPKGAKDLFNAFELLDTEHQNKSNLYIIGRGPLSEELKKRAIQYSNVKILDWVNSSNLPYIYSQLDFFVLASHFDGFSTVSCEAASMSLPLILTDKVGAVPDLICNNNGFVVPTKNPQELANAITKMIDLTEQERKEMGKISRINFEKCASIQININTLYNICHD